MIVLLVLLLSLPAAAQFSGERALRDAAKAVSFGPRPPNSEAIGKTRTWLKAELQKIKGIRLIEDKFSGKGPFGPVPMENIIARLPGSTGKAIVFTGHYDTKVFPRFQFVGANDAGSSTGFLLELARTLAAKPRRNDVYFVWFDGEEAFGNWSETDGIHGSRHLAERWRREGFLPRVLALFNVDMIGDRNLHIVEEGNSSVALRRLVGSAAADLGLGRYFFSQEGYIEDDHMPFVRLGVPAMDLIDFDYGPGNRYWHTADDTVDKLAATSFEVVGRVLAEVHRRLDQPAAR